jgi:ammonium transporter, Amt family
MMQCFAITALVTVLWTVYGYSVAFDATGMVPGETNLYSFVGGLGKMFFAGVTRDSLTLTIPETVFATFQMTFAIITPALIVGAFAERMRFGALLLFVTGWFTLSYLPIAHMVWAGPGAFRRRYGGAYQRWCRGTRGLLNAGQAQRLSNHGHAAT